MCFLVLFFNAKLYISSEFHTHLPRFPVLHSSKRNSLSKPGKPSAVLSKALQGAGEAPCQHKAAALPWALNSSALLASTAAMLDGTDP